MHEMQHAQKNKKNATGLTAQLVGKALGLERLSPETRSLSAIGGLPETATGRT